MLNIVLYEPEIPENTGNIMRTCVATNSILHLIRPLGFRIDEKSLKRSGVNYLDKLKMNIYDDYNDFLSKNTGDFYFLTRYGKKPHTSFDYSDLNKNIFLIFGKESTGIPKEILHDNLEKCLRIPMSENVRCINVSNSVAIMAYEVLRQQNFPNLSLIEVQKGEDFLNK